MNTKIISLLVSLFSFASFASSEGVIFASKKDEKITGFTRPCCNFGNYEVLRKVGVGGILDEKSLGEHYFGRFNKKKDTVGINYTCSGGFIDISHLRDNADWAARIYWGLPEFIGSGKVVEARNEGGFTSRSVFFPKLDQKDVQSLTQEDREKLTIALTFSMALLHEIPTAFDIAVSAPETKIIYERASAFSVEDAYSNLLGAYLGTKAAAGATPYNPAMTQILSETLRDLNSQSIHATKQTYNMIVNDWWTKTVIPGFKNVRKRDFTYRGEVIPRLVSESPFCQNETPKAIEIPELLSNGKSVHDYFEVQGFVSKKLRRGLMKIGYTNKSSYITQRDFPDIIEVIKADFISKLGHEIEH